jgi:hypothetical protein
MSKEALWKPEWKSAPKGTVGACFNSDGCAWFWSVKPEIKGSEKRPWDLKWRGPEFGVGYTMIGYPADIKRALWKESWLDRPRS